MCKDCIEFYPLHQKHLRPEELADDAFVRDLFADIHHGENDLPCINYFSLLSLSLNHKSVPKYSSNCPSKPNAEYSRTEVHPALIKNHPSKAKNFQNSPNSAASNVYGSFLPLASRSSNLNPEFEKNTDNQMKCDNAQTKGIQRSHSFQSYSGESGDDNTGDTSIGSAPSFGFDEDTNLSVASFMSNEDFFFTNDKKEMHRKGFHDGVMISSLLDDGDRNLVSEFTNAVVNEMQVTSFGNRDRKGKRSSFPNGYAGMSCRHCDGKVGRTGRYFPSSVKTISDSKKSLYAMHKHLSTCTKCPDSVKLTLDVLFKKHAESRKRNRRQGTQRAYFRKIWHALHPIQDRSINPDL